MFCFSNAALSSTLYYNHYHLLSKGNQHVLLLNYIIEIVLNKIVTIFIFSYHTDYVLKY